MPGYPLAETRASFSYQVAIQVRHRVVQRSSGFCDRQGLGNDPQAVLLAFQTRLAIGDQRVEEIRFRLVEETKVGTPAHHVTNDVDTGLPYLGCHRSHLQFFNVASLLDLLSRQCGEQTPRVPAIHAWHRHAVRGHVRETVHGRHGEAFLRLSTIRNNLRAGSSTSRQGILHGDIVLGKDLCLRDTVRIGILAPLRSATAALAYFLWGRSALPRSQHSLHRCADVAANTQPRDEGIRCTSSLVLVWGTRCPAIAGRCLEHHEASRSTASSRRMISAVQHESFAERYH